jgi:putative spermidine/putrescine transport system permease protein
VFRKVLFPLTLPALAASSALVFILSLGFYVTLAILGGGRVPMIANMMDMLINHFARWEMASVNAVALLADTLELYGLYQWRRRKS